MYGAFTPDISQFLHYGVLVLLGILCIGILIRTLWAPMDLYRRPCCGACGHAVSDILQGKCPECGGNYAKVGITTPPMAVRLRGSLWLALLAWTTLMAVIGGATIGWLEQRAWMASATSTSVAFGPGGPGKQSETFTTSLYPWAGTSIPGRGPSSPGRSEQTNIDDGFRISLALSTVTDNDTVESGTCVMTLRRNGASEKFPLSIDLPAGKFTIKDDNGKELASGPEADAVVVEKWFKVAGLDTEDRATKRTIQDVLKLLRYAKNDPKAIETLTRSFQGSFLVEGALQSSGSSSSFGPSPMTAMPAMPATNFGPGLGKIGLAAGVFGVVYLAGCIGIVWRNRRALRAA